MKAPFPWFGGKSRVSDIVWDRFGDPANYVEPFFGSGAVLLNRPTEAGVETVNDLDCMVANFWRALQADPGAVAFHADWPVNEADQHARHLWLVSQADFRERMKTDAEFYDANTGKQTRARELRAGAHLVQPVLPAVTGDALRK
jgi:site-specific DNA-adenine methylase